MDEERKVRVAITHDKKQNQSSRHDLEHYLTPKKNRKPSFQKQDLLGWLKPVLFAIVIGLIFGVGLMYYFSDFTADEPSGSNGEQALPVTTEEEDETEENGQASFSMTPQHFKLIQYGLFSTEENAMEHLSMHKETVGLPAFIIQRDQSYYVVGGYLSSGDEETQAISWLEDQGLVRLEDFLTKEWQLSQEGFQATEEEKAWLDSGLALIETNSFTMDSWSGWVQSMPQSLENQRYVSAIQELSMESGGEFMEEKTAQLSLLFFLSELE